MWVVCVFVVCVYVCVYIYVCVLPMPRAAITPRPATLCANGGSIIFRLSLLIGAAVKCVRFSGRLRSAATMRMKFGSVKHTCEILSQLLE
jgi:hypothetical protein